MLRLQREMRDQRRSVDVRPSEHRNPGEVILLILEIKISKGACGLQSPLNITCGLAPYDILLVREGFEQSFLFELLASVEAQVGHHCAVLGEKDAFAVTCVGNVEAFLENYSS